MRPSFPFEMVRVRLDRALQHLEAFENRIQWLGGNNPYSVGINRDGETGYYFVTATIPQAPPNEWGLLISEFSHNLRAALDNLVWQLALKRTIAPFDYAGFPVYLSQSGFNSGGNRLVTDLSPLQQVMIERTQPYHRRNPRRDPLWLLHQINNADKHRFLPVVAQPKFNLDTLRFDGPTQDITVYTPRHMENGTQLARYMPTSFSPGRNVVGATIIQEAKVQVLLQGSLVVRFGDSLEDISRYQVLPLMWDIYERISKIVHRFQTQLSL